jgi:hypothetical protein
MTNVHFKADNVAGGYVMGNSKPAENRSSNREHRHREHKERAPRLPAAIDEDDEIRKAIELSKVTAQKEEAARLKELAKS